MKILNLYCGIGGNRKLWGDNHEITAIEINPKIAKIYSDFFPKDKVIVTDAHKYLLEHYKEFDFIWSSPPCTSHSDIRRMATHTKYKTKPLYPDMKLYEEIIFLNGYFKGKWVVENVIGYYEPLIKPKQIGRHYFWSNFILSNMKVQNSEIENGKISYWKKISGFDLSKYKGINKRLLYRNCVNSDLGLHIFEMSFKKQQLTLTELKGGKS